MRKVMQMLELREELESPACTLHSLGVFELT